MALFAAPCKTVWTVLPRNDTWCLAWQSVLKVVGCALSQQLGCQFAAQLQRQATAVHSQVQLHIVYLRSLY